MKNISIMLVCRTGMSTSLIVSKMKKAAEDKGIDADIVAVSLEELEKKLAVKQSDVIFLGPQVRDKQLEIEKIAANYTSKVDTMDEEAFATLDGESLLQTAVELIK